MRRLSTLLLIAIYTLTALAGAAHAGDGSADDEGLMGIFLNVGKRALTGESLCLADRILEHVPVAGGKSKGEGSVLGGLGDLLDGDN